MYFKVASKHYPAFFLKLSYCLSNFFPRDKSTENICLAGKAFNHNTIKYINSVIILFGGELEGRVLTMPHATSYENITFLFNSCGVFPCSWDVHIFKYILSLTLSISISTTIVYTMNTVHNYKCITLVKYLLICVDVQEGVC